MVDTQVIQRIGLEFLRLSEALGDPIPPWDFLEGTTSVFIHPSGESTCPNCGPAVKVVFEGQEISLRCSGCGGIFFGREFVDELDLAGDEVDLVALVAHEFWHWHQFIHNLHQEDAEAREVNARRFAKQWALQQFPGRERELNFQFIATTSSSRPREPGITVDRQQIIAGIQVPPELAARLSDVSTEDLLFLNESIKLIGRPPPVSSSKWLRFKLQRDGPNYVYRLWKDYREFLARLGFDAPSYQAFRRLIWLTTEIGLVEFVRQEEASFGVRRFYRVVDDLAADDAWNNPTKALYG